MRIKSVENRQMTLAILVAFIPDVTVAIIAASLLADPYDSWWGLFFLWFIGIQIVTFLLWVKNSVWLWIYYKISNKRIMKDNCLNFFQHNNLPEPDEYEDSAGDYLWRISSNKEEDPEKRVQATILYTLYDGLSLSALYQRKIQMAMAMDDALMQYKEIFNNKK